jgi:hypothetical protein
MFVVVWQVAVGCGSMLLEIWALACQNSSSRTELRPFIAQFFIN